MRKQISIIVTLAMFAYGGVFTYGKVTGENQETKKRVERLQEDVDEAQERIYETKEEIDEEEKVNVKQTVLLEQIGLTLNNLNKKIDEVTK